MSKKYEFAIAEHVPVGAEVGTGYSYKYLKNPLDVPADLVQIAKDNVHVRFEWRMPQPSRQRNRRKGGKNENSILHQL